MAVSTPLPTTLDEWLSQVQAGHPVEIELGLERIGLVGQRLGLTPGDTRILTVAGTNGKGSCVAAAEAALGAAGLRVGCYTSPHLQHYSERVRVEGQPLDEATLCEGFARVQAARGEVPLTFFEFGTLAALVNLFEAELDVLVLEVGLGGRLDAVNLVSADVAVITSIDLDHCDWLGEDRAAIAVEKAGVARAGKPLVCGDPAPPPNLAVELERVGAELWQRGRDFDIEVTPSSTRLSGRSETGQPWQFHLDRSPCLAPASVACALQAVALLGVALDSERVEAAVAASLPGRFQRQWLGELEVVLDVAHNPAAARNLAQRLAALPPARTAVLFGMLEDKDIDGVVAELKDQVMAWMLAEMPDVPRAPRAPALVDRLREQGVTMVSVSKNLRQAWRRSLSLLGPGDRLLVCGSFHVVGPVLGWLEQEQRRLQRRAES